MCSMKGVGIGAQLGHDERHLLRHQAGDEMHDLFLHQQGLDTTTPAGKALFQMMGVFAEFEYESAPG